MLTHFVLVKVLGWRRRTYFTDGGTVTWASYHDGDGRKRFSKKLY